MLEDSEVEPFTVLKSVLDTDRLVVEELEETRPSWLLRANGRGYEMLCGRFFCCSPEEDRFDLPDRSELRLEEASIEVLVRHRFWSFSSSAKRTLRSSRLV